MATDYAARIVARATGEPLAAAPSMAPRGAGAAPEPEAIDPFEGAAAENTGAGREALSAPADAQPEPLAPNELAPVAPLATDAQRDPEVVTRRVEREPVSGVEPPTHPDVVEHERIMERVVERVEQREVVAETRELQPEPPAARDAPPPNAPPQVVSATPTRHVEQRAARDDALRGAEPRLATPTPPLPRQLAPRATHTSPPSAPARLQPHAAVQPMPRRAPERPRLVIERLIVEVAPPAVAPRPAARVAAPAPRPFRVGSPPSIAVGRPSGLAQG